MTQSVGPCREPSTAASGTQAVDRAAPLVVDGRARRRAADLRGPPGDLRASPSRRPRGCSPRSSAPSCSSATSRLLRRRSALLALRHAARPVGRAGAPRAADPRARRRRHRRDRQPRRWPAATGSSRSPRSTRRYLLGTRDWTEVDVPAHCSALGKVLLAYGVLDLPAGELEQLTPHTRHRPRRRSPRSSRRSRAAAGPAPSTSSRSGSPASPCPCAAASGDVSPPWASRVPAHGWTTGATRSAGC